MPSHFHFQEKARIVLPDKSRENYMTYDDLLATRLRAALSPLPELVEKKMFGGVCFLVNGNMACGVYKDDLIVRIGAEKYQAALSRPHTKLFDITGKALKGWVMVEPQGCATQANLIAWVEQGLAFARSLPGK
jgi:TfoX/Sxy family transcriptional regulator of competence genes